MYLVISASLNSGSRSRLLAREIHDRLATHTGEVALFDLQETKLPMCDAGLCYSDPAVRQLGALVQNARGIVIASPVYNYDLSAAAKNVVELTGKAWTGKVVGFVCSAGGSVSYMAPMGLANSLMLDFRSLIVPRFVFATGKAFSEAGQLIDEEIQARLAELAAAVFRLGEFMASIPGT